MISLPVEEESVEDQELICLKMSKFAELLNTILTLHAGMGTVYYWKCF